MLVLNYCVCVCVCVLACACSTRCLYGVCAHKYSAASAFSPQKCCGLVVTCGHVFGVGIEVH